MKKSTRTSFSDSISPETYHVITNRPIFELWIMQCQKFIPENNPRKHIIPGLGFKNGIGINGLRIHIDPSRATIKLTKSTTKESS